MKKVASLLFVGLLSAVSGCSKQSASAPSSAPDSPTVAQAAAPARDPAAAPVPAPVAPIVEDIRFLNQHFVISDNSAGKFAPTGVRADESHIFFEFDHTDPGKPRAHYVESALATNLDPQSVRADFVGWLHVGCKNDKTCVSQTDSGEKNEFLIGPVAEAYSDEAKQHLKRILLLQQGISAPEITHAPTDDPSEAAGVQVAKSFVNQDGIRVIVARNETTGRAVFFACETVMDGGLINRMCPQPRLRITYTVERVDGSNTGYWMNPEGSDDKYDGKHLLVSTFTPN